MQNSKKFQLDINSDNKLNYWKFEFQFKIYFECECVLDKIMFVMWELRFFGNSKMVLNRPDDLSFPSR